MSTPSAGALAEGGVDVVLGELPAQLAAEERVGRVAGGGEEEPLLVAPDHGEEGIRRIRAEVEVVVVDDDVHPPVERGEPAVELPGQGGGVLRPSQPQPPEGDVDRVAGRVEPEALVPGR